MTDDLEVEQSNDGLTVRLIRRILDMPESQQAALLKQLDDGSAGDLFSSERDDARRNFRETIHFSVKDRMYTGISQDISAGGMFIETGDTFTVGQTIILSIPLASKQKRIKVPAQIARTMPHGIGVEFVKKYE